MYVRNSHFICTSCILHIQEDLCLSPSPDPPEIVMAPEELIEAREGNTVFLVCVAIGTPLPSISWTHSDTGNRYESGTDDGMHRVNEETVMVEGVEFVRSVLEICGIEMDDAGQYQCEAENSAGLSYASFNITVEEPLGEWVSWWVSE